jgi:hypothetical protein
MTKGKKQPIESSNHDSANLSFVSSVSRGDGEDFWQKVAVDGGEWSIPFFPKPQREILSFRTTPIGRLSPTVWDSLGVFDEIIDAIVHTATPKCPSCKILAAASEAFDEAIVPLEGYLALVVDGMVEEPSLEEQCELIGCSRALVDNRLVRTDEIDGRTGEPVIALVNVLEARQVATEAELWFAKGGGSLRVIAIAQRDSEARNLQRLSHGWLCSGCGRSFPTVTRQMLDDAEPCVRCKGEGWLLVEEGRYVACEDCNGFGSTSPLAQYVCGDVPLSQVSAESLQFLSSLLKRKSTGSLSESFRNLERLAEGELGNYPLGAAQRSLSSGERLRISMVSSEISGLAHVRVGVDGSMYRGVEKAPHINISSPGDMAVSAPFPSNFSMGSVVVRDIERGPLSVPHLEIPLANVSFIQGPVGVGKTLLLSEVDGLFAKRRKYAHRAVFGSLKRCVFVRPDDRPVEAVVSLLGLETEIARLAVTTRQAKEKGLVEDDFVYARSRYKCSRCAPLRGDGCPECGGCGFEPTVALVDLGGLSVQEALTRPLADVARSLVISDLFNEVLQRIPASVFDRICLGTAGGAIEPSIGRFCQVIGPLIGLLVNPKRLKEALVLIDNPFCFGDACQQAVVNALSSIITEGATVVCAGVPEALEKLSNSVVRLQPTYEQEAARARSRFFDSRMSRGRTVVVAR